MEISIIAQSFKNEGGKLFANRKVSVLQIEKDLFVRWIHGIAVVVDFDCD